MYPKYVLIVVCPCGKLIISNICLRLYKKYAPRGLTADAELKGMLTFKYYCMSVGDGNINQGYYVIMKELSKDADEDDN